MWKNVKKASQIWMEKETGGEEAAVREHKKARSPRDTAGLHVSSRKLCFDNRQRRNKWQMSKEMDVTLMSFWMCLYFYPCHLYNRQRRVTNRWILLAQRYGQSSKTTPPFLKDYSVVSCQLLIWKHLGRDNKYTSPQSTLLPHEKKLNTNNVSVKVNYVN